ncbi:MAG: hypothetical protein GX638_12730 [Crenarchaeota archaeon]|nr:hypothetical protein [Thermoproteota archaeon]
MQSRDDSTLYPFWRVELYLDKVYAGGVGSIAVGIWADTGEIRYCNALSYGGPVPSDSIIDVSPTLAASPSLDSTMSPSVESPKNTIAQLDLLYIAGAIAAVALVSIVIIFIKRKSK